LDGNCSGPRTTGVAVGVGVGTGVSVWVGSSVLTAGIAANVAVLDGTTIVFVDERGVIKTAALTEEVE